MVRSKASILLLVCAALLVALSFSRQVADAQQGAVTFEAVPRPVK